jgi:hypothetical protein
VSHHDVSINCERCAQQRKMRNFSLPGLITSAESAICIKKSESVVVGTRLFAHTLKARGKDLIWRSLCVAAKDSSCAAAQRELLLMKCELNLRSHLLYYSMSTAKMLLLRWVSFLWAQNKHRLNLYAA